VRDERDDSFITHDSSSSSSSSSSDDDEEAVRGGVLAGDVSVRGAPRSIERITRRSISSAVPPSPAVASFFPPTPTLTLASPSTSVSIASSPQDTDSERGDDAAAPRAAREEERSPMLPRRGGETRTRKRDRKNVASWLASGLENASSDDDDDDDDVTRGNDAEATRRRANREAGAPIAVRDGNGNRNRNRFADHPGNAAADPTLRARRHGHKQKRRASRRDVEGAAEKTNRRATRETKRRLARRRAYAPASAALVARLAAMYFAFVVIVLADVFATAMACYVNPGAHVRNDGADATWTAFCLMALIGAPAMAAHLAGW
jgi:hypothetical protein